MGQGRRLPDLRVSMGTLVQDVRLSQARGQKWAMVGLDVPVRPALTQHLRLQLHEVAVWEAKVIYEW